MKSHDVNDHGVSDRSIGQTKKPWVTPSLEVIALENAEGGTTHHGTDGGGNFNRPRS